MKQTIISLFHMWPCCAVSFLISALIAFVVTPILILVAMKARVVDRPDGSIKKHKDPVPYLGGVAIYCSFFMGVASLAGIGLRELLLFLALTLFMLLGLYDDLFRVPPIQKFLGQLVVASLFVWFWGPLETGIGSKPLDLFISIFWLLSLVNAINLLDVMDGLATVSVLIPSGALLFISCFLGDFNMAIIISGFMGALLGFACYNFPPAKIYLGDAGSLMLGGFVGMVPLIFRWSQLRLDGVNFPYLAAVAALGVPLVEGAWLITVRSLKGVPFYRGSNHHLTHYMQQKGIGEVGILAYVSLMSLLCVAAGVAYLKGVFRLIDLILFGTVFAVVWVVALLRCDRSARVREVRGL